MINKGPNEQAAYRRHCFQTNSARQGEELFLEALKRDIGDFEVILPAYIGYSSREGSGIYDPIRNTGVEHSFYVVKSDLTIDKENLSEVLVKTPKKKVVFLVHYFGMLDPNLEEIVEICKRNNCIILEDCAHALYTDIVDGKCGMYGNAILYSLHKMLPLNDGGMLITYDDYGIDKVATNGDASFLDFDLRRIANVRKQNALIWSELLENYGKVRPLRKYQPDITYQTFPIMLDSEEIRDKLYFGLNERGYGAVSLYHELVESLYVSDYADSVFISKHILNLPVHQDVDESMIFMMFKEMKDILRG